MTSPVWTNYIPVDEAVAVLRAAFSTETYAEATFGVKLSSERTLEFGGHCCGEGGNPPRCFWSSGYIAI